ncbi:VanZ family protein [Deinococcus sp.]|uniref:VanZ family protein n=1 Tax=Deinococcus sp. TaxID=47478 RepID=UPI00345DAD45
MNVPLRRGKPLWWLPTLLLAGLIWFLSSRSSTPVPLPHPIDWVAHASAYLALGFSLGKASGNWQLAWVLAAWFGALDEVHQAFVPPREAGIGDWWFDLIGSGLGSWWAAGRVSRQPEADQTGAGQTGAGEFDTDDDSGQGAGRYDPSDRWTAQPGEPRSGEHLPWPKYDINFDEAQ